MSKLLEASYSCLFSPSSPSSFPSAALSYLLADSVGVFNCFSCSFNLIWECFKRAFSLLFFFVLIPLHLAHVHACVPVCVCMSVWIPLCAVRLSSLTGKALCPPLPNSPVPSKTREKNCAEQTNKKAAWRLCCIYKQSWQRLCINDMSRVCEAVEAAAVFATRCAYVALSASQRKEKNQRTHKVNMHNYTWCLPECVCVRVSASVANHCDVLAGTLSEHTSPMSNMRLPTLVSQSQSTSTLPLANKTMKMLVVCVGIKK